uniref:Candidate secreted effector n=1 Tax=Meloidogyne incognita TaxID=6306 RepID=A0A914L387_MELIC
MNALIKLYSLLILFNIILDSCCSASNERRYDYSNWHCCHYSYIPAASSFTSGGGGGFNGNGGGGIQSVVNVSPYGGISTTFTAGGGGGGSGAGFQRVTGPGGTVVVAAGGGGFGNGYGYGYAWGRRI